MDSPTLDRLRAAPERGEVNFRGIRERQEEAPKPVVKAAADVAAEVAADVAAETSAEEADAAAAERRRSEQARRAAEDAEREAHRAKDDASQARDDASKAQDGAQDARQTAESARDTAEQARETAEDARDEALLAAADDPLLDTNIRRLEAHADDENPFGLPGRPLGQRSPFRIGFTAALGVAGAYVILRALIDARQVLVLVAASAFLAIGLNPSVMWLERQGFRRRTSIGVVFTAVISFFVIFGLAVVPPVVAQAAQFVEKLPDYITALQDNRRISELNDRYAVLDRLRGYVENGRIGSQAVGGVVGLGQLVLGTFFSLATVLILTLYFLSSFPDIKATAYRLVPRTRRARVGLLGDEMLAKVGGYVAGALTISGIATATSFVFLVVADVPYPLALAILVGLTALVPLIGATVGALVVTLVCLTVSVPVAIASAVFFVIYQQVENYVIYPRVMGRTVDVSPAATIVAVLVGGALLGVLGALLAIPTAAALQLLLREVVIPRQDAL